MQQRHRRKRRKHVSRSQWLLPTLVAPLLLLLPAGALARRAAQNSHQLRVTVAPTAMYMNGCRSGRCYRQGPAIGTRCSSARGLLVKERRQVRVRAHRQLDGTRRLGKPGSEVRRYRNRGAASNSRSGCLP
ncbi:hypothetical protein JKP88DRAFT_246517 [Tribonema minus]|uniref:Secreted protein n=1 Tax=Tribonema minus TaxID=303371 RepID=A0A835Z0N5_9STRA|nr:hypothetical protein JKP88DRAFT_246517 [Tribonema minus]